MLIKEAWTQRRMDPSLLMCLVIPKSDLERDVEWGKEMWDMVTGILGTSEQGVVSDVIAQVRGIYAERQMVGRAPGFRNDETSARFGCVAHGFKKVECSEMLQLMVQKNNKDHGSPLWIPFMAQYVKPGLTLPPKFVMIRVVCY